MCVTSTLPFYMNDEAISTGKRKVGLSDLLIIFRDSLLIF